MQNIKRLVATALVAATAVISLSACDSSCEAFNNGDKRAVCNGETR